MIKKRTRWPLLTFSISFAGLLVFMLGSLLMTRPARADVGAPTPSSWGDSWRGIRATPTPNLDKTADRASAGSQSTIPTGTFTYVVQLRDTPWSMAVDFGRNIESLACSTAPYAPDPYNFRPGQTITIPALNTICHEVKAGQTIDEVAALYGVRADSIVEITWNALTQPPYILMSGQHLLVYQREGVEQPLIALPRRSLPRWDLSALPFDPANPPEGTHVTPDGYYWQGVWPYGDGKFAWPLAGGWLSQGYNRARHRAIDLAVAIGTEVKAADNGVVVLAGWNSQGYGYRVVIDHNNHYLTLYAHLSNYYVKPGDVVEKGAIIGAVGSTGNSTGPHLHFELRDFGRLVDPLAYLPKR